MKKRFGLWDAISIVVGIVVGTTIFRSPTLVFQNTSGPWQALAIWVLGGVLCILGALVYSELATAYPRDGGDYEYLRRAFGPTTGFLFGWAQLTVVLTGSIGALAYAFADYGARLWDLPVTATAVASIVLLSGLNLLGVLVGKSVQNVLTAAKVLGLVGVIAAGLFAGSAPESVRTAPSGPGLGLALVFVLYAYGGWNNAVFVAAEVEDQRRNLPRAMILGLVLITLIYLAMNMAYLALLGFDDARESATPAADALQRAVGPWGGKAISVLVMISALGAMNGTILTGSRVYATVGEDHRAFRRLGSWNRRSAPAAALIAQGVIALLLVLAVGTAAGRGLIDVALAGVGFAKVPWEEYFGGFEALVAGSAPVFWGFFLLTGVAQILLRIRDRERARPFRAPLHPLPAVVFCAMCLFMLWSSVSYARWLALLGVVPLLLGLPLAWLDVRSRP
ncbi:MAG: APC family permease [Planctomycetota bacterium]